MEGSRPVILPRHNSFDICAWQIDELSDKTLASASNELHYDLVSGSSANETLSKRAQGGRPSHSPDLDPAINRKLSVLGTGTNPSVSSRPSRVTPAIESEINMLRLKEGLNIRPSRPWSFEDMVTKIVTSAINATSSRTKQRQLETWKTRSAVRKRLLPLGNPLPPVDSPVVTTLEDVVEDVFGEIETQSSICQGEDTTIAWLVNLRDTIRQSISEFASGQAWLRHLIYENTSGPLDDISLSDRLEHPQSSLEIVPNQDTASILDQGTYEHRDQDSNVDSEHETDHNNKFKINIVAEPREEWSLDIVPDLFEMIFQCEHNNDASPQNYVTARSSLASYATAPSKPYHTTSYLSQQFEFETRRITSTRLAVDHDANPEFESMMKSVLIEVMERGSPVRGLSGESIERALRTQMRSLLRLGASVHLINLLDKLILRIRNMVNFPNPTEDVSHLRSRLKEHIHRYVSCQPHHQDTMLIYRLALEKEKIFSSAWLSYLKGRGLILHPKDALDWSGRGQHVEYQDEEAKDIPLQSNGYLGHGSSGIVDRVRCRRVDLARKKIRCNRRLTKEQAITEVEHLQRLQHRHIIRLVGTYTVKKTLNILLYPVASWNLEEFIDALLEDCDQLSQDAVRSLSTFVACLAGAIDDIHTHNIKHMDIKPSNLLIRQVGKTQRIYIADFGIARAYKCAEESYTSSPTPFTKLYAAPEVVEQSPRGFPADIFSLGCVFMEILAAIMTTPTCNEREQLRIAHSKADFNAYHANTYAVVQWFERANSGENHRLRFADFDRAPGCLTHCIWDNVFCGSISAYRMLHKWPSECPTARALWKITYGYRCEVCSNGPEPFEAA